MDTGLEYILKAEKATEIQDKWRGLPADFYVYKYKNKHLSHVRLNPYSKNYRPRQGIWLPRQDQLQAMVPVDPNLQLLTRFVNWVVTDGEIYESFRPERIWNRLQSLSGRLDKSMEQLWLGFVMWELYQKRWDGKDWVKV